MLSESPRSKIALCPASRWWDKNYVLNVKNGGFPKITHPIFIECKYVNALSLSTLILLLIDVSSKVGP